MTCRDDLISRGLIHPKSSEEEAKRNGILMRISEGEKIKDAPIYCVFKADGPYKHIQYDGEKRCKSAELIEDKLYSYESHVLCTRLNDNDDKLPLTWEKSLYRQSLYKICSMSEWKEWQDDMAQVTIFD